MTAFVSDIGKIECSNENPHITLLLRGKAEAVESNFILEEIRKEIPEIFKAREQKIVSLVVKYRT